MLSYQMVVYKMSTETYSSSERYKNKGPNGFCQTIAFKIVRGTVILIATVYKNKGLKGFCRTITFKMVRATDIVE